MHSNRLMSRTSTSDVNSPAAAQTPHRRNLAQYLDSDQLRMGRPEGIEAVLAAKFQVLLPHLDERQRRLGIGAEALSLGHGGIRIVVAAAGVREGTVSRGAAELGAGQGLLGRVRRPDGGRKG